MQHPPRLTFPILAPHTLAESREVEAAGLGYLTQIPWSMIEAHEPRAQRNHDQSLATLAERCGLSACEAVAVLEDRPWRDMPIVAAYKRLETLVSRHLAAPPKALHSA